MIRKILCRFGFHKWEKMTRIGDYYDYHCPHCSLHKKACSDIITCFYTFGKNKQICKHCGKVK